MKMAAIFARFKGTEAELQIQMDRPMKDGLIALDNDQQITAQRRRGQRL